MSHDADDPLAWIDDQLRELDSSGLRRHLLTRIGPQGPSIIVADQETSTGSFSRELINFSSNDYLSLAADPRLAAAAHEAAQREGWGAGASPLVTGHSESHRRLEERLANFLGTEAALAFPSGFAANSGTIAALVEGGPDRIFADEKNHASLIDGCRLSRTKTRVYPHRDMGQLAELLSNAENCRRRLIVTDSLFSMDGDLAPLAHLVELARQHRAMLMVDEAHAIGVFGAAGCGLAEHLGLEAEIPIRVGTLSKALGSGGGFVAGRRSLIDWLLNRARPYVFSTAHPPAVAAAAVAALDIVHDEPQRRLELLDRAARLRDALRSQGWNLGDAVGQIIPVIIGPADATMRLSADLRRRGLFVPGIRPPSVPPGESLLRVSLSYGHTREMIEQLVRALGELRGA